MRTKTTTKSSVIARRKFQIKFTKSYPSIFFAIEFAGVGEENSAGRHVEAHSKRLSSE